MGCEEEWHAEIVGLARRSTNGWVHFVRSFDEKIKALTWQSLDGGLVRQSHVQ